MKLLFLILILTAQVYSQGICVIDPVRGGSIRGKVVSGEDKIYPVNGALVKVFARNRLVKKISTDVNGNFYLGTLSKGNYELAVSYPSTVTLFVPARIRAGERVANVTVKLGVLVGVPCGGGDVQKMGKSH